MNRYQVYSNYLKNKYGEKVYKLPTSIPVTCPNRDGSCGKRGCVFCGEIGAGYENLPDTMTVTEQIEKNIAHIAPKYKAKKYIPYFQNFSNTYLEPEKFRAYMIEAASHEAVVGLALATRPDCIHEVYLDILKEIERTYHIDIYIELGLQTVNPHTLIKINRGHTLGEFIDAVLRIKAYSFSICTHLILNLPWDDRIDVIESAKVLSALPIDQVKLHGLYILKNTVMAKWYEEKQFDMVSVEEYVERVVLFLRHLRSDIVLQRLIGRVPAENTLFANWSMGWWKIRDMIDARMEELDAVQGDLCQYLHGKEVQKFL